MSAKSRGRHRFDPPAEPAVTAEEQQQLDDVVDAYELADVNPRAGISKFVGAVFGARDRSKESPDDGGLTPGKTGERAGERDVHDDSGTGMPAPSSSVTRALREPTPYERAVLGGMSRKPMYGGTVEPWRVDGRRRRNRAARKSRRSNRLAAKR